MEGRRVLPGDDALVISAMMMMMMMMMEIATLCSLQLQYGLGRAVTSTPAFFVNGGAIYSTGDSDWTAEDLRSVIDPLLTSRRAREL